MAVRNTLTDRQATNGWLLICNYAAKSTNNWTTLVSAPRRNKRVCSDSSTGLVWKPINVNASSWVAVLMARWADDVRWRSVFRWRSAILQHTTSVSTWCVQTCFTKQAPGVQSSNRAGQEGLRAPAAAIMETKRKKYNKIQQELVNKVYGKINWIDRTYKTG